jgi:hypothetical protein
MRSIMIVISFSVYLAENRAVSHFVCVCNFELLMAVKMHILVQHVGSQTVLQNCTMS